MDSTVVAWDLEFDGTYNEVCCQWYYDCSSHFHPEVTSQSSTPENRKEWRLNHSTVTSDYRTCKPCVLPALTVPRWVTCQREEKVFECGNGNIWKQIAMEEQRPDGHKDVSSSLHCTIYLFFLSSFHQLPLGWGIKLLCSHLFQLVISFLIFLQALQWFFNRQISIMRTPPSYTYS